MMRVTEWQFGGWLRALPPAFAWGVLGALAVAGLVLVAWLYRRTLRELSPAARVSLTVLRAAIVLAVLLCLANPSRIERNRPDVSNHDTLAVLVDRSDSMSGADYRGTTRLASAARTWKQHEGEAGEFFSKITHQRFAVGLSPAKNLDDALGANEPGPETHLYEALRRTLETDPGAVVCLTDGLDTTQDNADALAAEAQRRGVRLYFVAGKNRAHAGEMLAVREVKAPPRVLRKTQFTAGTLIEAGAAQAGELPVELWSGEKKLAEARLPLRAGLNTLPWSVPVTADETGAMPLEFRVGDGSRRQIAACTTQVVEHTTVGVLYYQGALQWGYRFLRSAIESDPSFRMTSILNPALGVRMSVSAAGQAMLPDLPDDVRELKRFQIVVLAHAFPEQLTARQQQALVEYVRGGGGVLFIAPDTNATQGFAQTALERMLPVVFETPDAEQNADDATRRFHDQMLNAAGGSDLLNEGEQRPGYLPQLQAFALPPGANRASASAVFRGADSADMPQFCTYAKVRGAKPGASILAVTSQSRDGNPPRILLARQQFGDGFAAALTTDLLWRWKMSLPSGSHAAEKFWQQLLLSLAPESGTGLRVVKLTESPALNAPVRLRVDAASAESSLTAEAVSPSGKHKALALQKSADEQSAGFEAEFIPDSSGQWEVRATDAAQNIARITFPVTEKPRTTETLNLPPDVEGMRRLAESTGGALVEDAPVFEKRAAVAGDAQMQRVHPLWDSSWLLGLLLGLYGTELVVRRCFRLL